MGESLLKRKHNTHQSIHNEELFHIDGESQFILDGRMVCVAIEPVKKQSWIVRLAKWLRRS
jgi:hypothetical protein